MKVGVTVMTTDDPAGIAKAAEERGFYSFYMPEHTHLPVEQARPEVLVGGVEEEDYRNILDPYIALAMAASSTERIMLGTGISLVAQHDPIVLAKQIATLDLLSGGRFVLGLGYGWNRLELANHGLAFEERRDVLREKVLCMQSFWSEDPSGYEGAHVHVSPSHAHPKPIQQPRVRTLVGGGAGPKLFAAIAELFDGWMPIGGAGLGEALPELRRVVEEAGRDPAELHIVPFGTIPDEGKLDHFEEIGITEVVLRVQPPLTRDGILSSFDELSRFVR